MTIPKLLSHWRGTPRVIENVAAWQELPPRPAQTRPLPAGLPPALTSALQQRGVATLYSHQAQAWEYLQAGRSVMITAGTASGKTLCYTLPILDQLVRNQAGRALLIFPTKALAQDQLSSLRLLADALPGAELRAALYDGDTPARDRKAIRSQSRIVLTNPDMLHVGILPHHTEWAAFLQNLRFVVLDEAHTYRGVFGSHVANVIRRLKRLAAFYGGFPQFVLTTATLGNPGEFAARLVEQPVQVIEQDGAPRGPKTFIIYNPPVVDQELGLRRSAIHESVRLAQDLLDYDVQTILFAGSRRSVELLLTYLRQRLPAELAPHVRGYRSGYLPSERRAIEAGLRSGEVRAVAATTALELGIDIGGMGAAALVGYPGSISAAWQQAGRAGRGADASLALLITTSDPLDQFLAAHPHYLFDRPMEQALINPDNPLILLGHIRCAAFELPFHNQAGFGALPPAQVQEYLEFLAAEGALHPSQGSYYWVADAYPAQAISLRSASAETVRLQTLGDAHQPPRTIGLVDHAAALWMVHPAAIYLHEAQQYFVETLDLHQNVAHLRPIESDYTTQHISQTEVKLLEQHTAEPVPGGVKAQGDLQVTSQVVGFRKLRWFTHELLGIEPLDLPTTDLVTTGYWLALSSATVDHLRQEGLWRNDPNDYGPLWPAVRDVVRARDGFRCQVCGAAEQGRSHDVHHKIPFRLFASAAQANQPDNLTTLCHDCHMRAETSVRVRSGLAGLGYVLGNLAPFLLMCDRGDLGVHTDAQSSLAEGRPAVALYDQAPGGIGLSTRLYALHAELLARAHELVRDCACQDGCPACVGPAGAGLVSAANLAALGGKAETLAILRAVSPA